MSRVLYSNGERPSYRHLIWEDGDLRGFYCVVRINHYADLIVESEGVAEGGHQWIDHYLRDERDVVYLEQSVFMQRRQGSIYSMLSQDDLQGVLIRAEIGESLKRVGLGKLGR